MVTKLVAIVFCIFINLFFVPAWSGEIPEYTSLRTAGTITIDGKLVESSWFHAHPMCFRQIADGTPPLYGCGAKILWDDEYLYVGIIAETPDVWATYTGDLQLKGNGEHRSFTDAIMLHDSFVKVFLDPDGDGKNYMEIHINPFNVVNDVYLVLGSTRTDRQNISLAPSNYHDEWDYPGLQHAVNVNGTLNYSDDEDKGWSAELAFPWSSMESFTKGNCPPKPGDILRAHIGRVFKSKPGARNKYWTWPVIGVVDCHQLHRWGFVKFSDESAR